MGHAQIYQRESVMIITMDPLLIDGESLTIENVYEVAFDRRRVGVHPAASQKMARSRGVVEGIVNERRPVYGISTGFGKLSDVHIGEDDISQLQHNLLRSHASGIGQSFIEDEVRALILLRANVLAKGLSGVRLGMAPLKLQAKEGLALLNGTQATLAAGVICWRRARQLLDLSDLAGAMSLEAFKGSPT